MQVPRVQKKVLDPLELELQVVFEPLNVATKLGSLLKQQEFLTMEPSLQPFRMNTMVNMWMLVDDLPRLSSLTTVCPRD